MPRPRTSTQLPQTDAPLEAKTLFHRCLLNQTLETRPHTIIKSFLCLLFVQRKATPWRFLEVSNLNRLKLGSVCAGGASVSRGHSSAEGCP